MKRLFFVCFALAALASCEKESTVDSALTTNQPIVYAPYATASVTKGSAVNSNSEFASTNLAFQVAAYSETSSYFGFNKVTYSESKWVNDTKMYWPNTDSNLHFGAYSPAGQTFYEGPTYSYGESGHSLSFGYDVKDNVSVQKDLMYSLSDYEYEVPSTDIDDNEVNLHFKHALTQVGFTATKDSDISVYVTSIKVCNIVNGGVFTATAATDVDGSDDGITEDQAAANVNEGNFGTWDPKEAEPYVSDETVTNLSNYTAVMKSASVKVTDATTVTQLTSTTDVMMLLPQALTAWDATGTDNSQDGTESYLAIECKITHDDGEAAIVEGTIYVPFSTVGVDYTTSTITDDVWHPGYKITYNLHFGGGYTVPNTPDPTDPEPGQTPDPDDVIPTLRDITYTVTVDEWVPATGGTVSL